MVEPLRVIHVYPTLQERGGVETLLKIHQGFDQTEGLAPEFRMLFERQPGPSDPRYANFNFRWFHPLADMRREFGRVLATSAGSVVVHHNLWGMPFLAPADSSGRRLAFLHSNETFYRDFLPAQHGWLDGVMCCSPLELDNIRCSLPELDLERVIALPMPLALPAGLTRQSPARTEEVVLGYAGRIWRGLKRLDRLPLFLNELDRQGLSYRFEVLGDGPYLPRLRRRLAGRKNVRFAGWQGGADYWRTVASWDAAVYFSDVEGGPLTLLEAMAAGTIPFFPRIGGSLGDHYAPLVDPRCHYPAGDMAAAAQAVHAFFTSSRDVREQLRLHAAQLVRGHTVEAYERAFAGFIRRIAGLPRISRPAENCPQARLMHRLPLGYVTRFSPGLLRRP